MAEATGLRNNALPYPVYGVPWGITFPLLDADGDPISPSSQDSEISKNGDTFADCTNEATEIATSSGSCYLLLTATEMTTDVATVQIKSTGAKTTVITLYPAKLPQLRSGTVGANAADGSTLQLDSSASAVDDFYSGCLLVGTLDSNVEARIITDYAGSTKVCSVTPNFVTTPDNNDTFVVYQPLGRQFAEGNVMAWNGTAVASPHTAGYPVVTIKDGTGTGEIDTTSGGVLVAAIANNAITAASIATGAIDADAIADNAIDAGAIAADAITAAKIANGAIDAATFAADVDAEILSYLVDDATRIDASALNTASVTTIPAILTDTAEIGAAGAGLTEAGGDGDHLTAINLPNQTMDIVGNITGNLSGSVGSVTGNVGGNVTGSIGSLAAQAKADVNAEVDGAIETYRLDEVVAAAAAAPAADSFLADLLEDDGGVFRFTANALEEAPSGGGGGPTAEEIADEVETRTIAGVTTVGTVNALAANSVDASALAADAVTEIQSGLATAAELAKVPKSDSNVTWNSTALASIQSEANDALVAYDPPTKAELDSAVAPLATSAALATTDGKVDALPSAADNAAATLTTQMTESYAANGAVPTLAQAQFAMHQMLMQFGISGTSITVKKLDNATTAFIVTLDDATNPTAAVRT